jgi:plasmid stabilization system protein ParE
VTALRLLLTAAARKDITEAQDWYRREGPALAASFREELDRQFARVLRRPTQFPSVRADVRRAKLRRFPYSLLFCVMSDGIYVIACFHSSRDPEIWRRRV